MKRHALFIVAAVFIAVAAIHDAFDQWVDSTKLPKLTAETGVEVFDRNGALLRAFTVADGRWRLATSLEAVDPDYLKMLIAYEDKRFYQHDGVDWKAMLRAAAQFAQNGRVISGGSTLTMQVARLLEDSGTGRWRGKLRQIRVALALERKLSKDEILTLYLNRAPFGGNLEGVRAATRAWFGKAPRRLTPAQAALLIALPQSPESRRPDRNHVAAQRARDRILERLTKAGRISQATARAAKSEPVPDRRQPFPALAPHLTERILAQSPNRKRYQLTINATLQGQIEQLARMALQDKDRKLSIAIMVADHTTGEILASVGSGSYQADGRLGYVDMTRAIRSPGSTLKPLVYGMAFDQGLAHPETLIEDRPTAFGAYVPQNFDGQFRGTIRLRAALQQSLNIPAVKLLQAIGPARFVARLKRAGAGPVIPGGKPGLAVVLGGVGLTLRDLTQLYASLAEGGHVRFLYFDQNAMPVQSDKTLISPEAAWQVGNILSGLAPPPNAPRNRLAYKTGTSYGNRDTWAIGYDGQHVAGVWLGRADGTPVPGAFGAALAAPVLFNVFSRLKPELTPLGPPPPATLIASNAELPLPLQHFRTRDALFAKSAEAPQVSFPPDGSVLETDGPLVVKVRDGLAPFTWLVNGTPAIVASHDRQTQIDLSGPGFVTLSVIDAKGRSARSRITLR